MTRAITKSVDGNSDEIARLKTKRDTRGRLYVLKHALLTFYFVSDSPDTSSLQIFNSYALLTFSDRTIFEKIKNAVASIDKYKFSLWKDV